MIPGHEVKFEYRPVERWSASWNSAYSSSQQYMVCICGFEQESHLQSQDRKDIAKLEHYVDVLAAAVYGKVVI
jgi:hypothetical protein